MKRAPVRVGSHAVWRGCPDRVARYCLSRNIRLVLVCRQIGYRRTGEHTKCDQAVQLGTSDVIATSNIGCLQYLNGADAPPIVHFAELLDWAEGGAAPPALRNRVQLMTVDEPVD